MIIRRCSRSVRRWSASIVPLTRTVSDAVAAGTIPDPCNVATVPQNSVEVGNQGIAAGWPVDNAQRGPRGRRQPETCSLGTLANYYFNGGMAAYSVTPGTLPG